jgi:Icc-related predicted phosphoesterase
MAAMQIRVLSDLHLEFYPDQGEAFLKSLELERGDLLVLAGDIATAPILEQALERIHLLRPGKATAYVPGNHEYYGSSLKNLNQKLGQWRVRLQPLFILNNRLVELEGRRILGSTLWFPERPEARLYRSALTDFRAIQGFSESFAQANAEAVQFLQDNVHRGDIVITHHLPSYRSVYPEFMSNPLNGFYVCDLETLILEHKPSLWIHGHSHESSDYRIGSTRILSNPFGYWGVKENAAWDWGKTVNI